MFPLSYTSTVSVVFWSLADTTSESFWMLVSGVRNIDCTTLPTQECREEKTNLEWFMVSMERSWQGKTQTPQEHRKVSGVQLGQKPPSPSFKSSCQLCWVDQTPGTEALGNVPCLQQSWLQNRGGRCLSSRFRDIMSSIELYENPATVIIFLRTHIFEFGSNVNVL